MILYNCFKYVKPTFPLPIENKIWNASGPLRFKNEIGMKFEQYYPFWNRSLLRIILLYLSERGTFKANIKWIARTVIDLEIVLWNSKFGIYKPTSITMYVELSSHENKPICLSISFIALVLVNGIFKTFLRLYV